MNIYLILGIALIIHIVFWYFVSLAKKRMDVADIAWGLGFPLLCWISFIYSEFSLRSVLTNILISIWGLRLAYHIFQRNKNKTEDPRYAAWRKEWKNFYLRSFLQVFLLQGILLFFIAYPAIYTNTNSTSNLDIFTFLGIFIWIVGYYFEATGDAQLAEFIKNPLNKGKVMQQGLWKYTRHPNYFGEVTMWWGIFIIALGLPGGALTIFGPLTITYLILYVSGVPLLEQKYKNDPEYEKYKKVTSVFIPLPPKKI